MTTFEFAQEGSILAGKGQIQRIAPQPVVFELHAGEVLIAIKGTGLNRPDVLALKGLYPAGPNPESRALENALGLEFCGEVLWHEPRSNGRPQLRPGTLVIGLTHTLQLSKQGRDRVAGSERQWAPGGGLLKYALCPEEVVVNVEAHRNHGVPFLSCLPENACTALMFLDQVREMAAASGRAVKDLKILVTATRGALGSLFLELLQQEGAKEILQINREHIEDFIKSPPKGFADVVFDQLGGDVVAAHIAALRPGGCLLQAAFLRGPKAEVDLRPMMFGNLHWQFLTLKSQSLDSKSKWLQEISQRVEELFEFSKRQDWQFKLWSRDKAAEAMEWFVTSRTAGNQKVVLHSGR